MTEELKKDAMSWDEHLKAGMEGLKEELKDSLGVSDSMSSTMSNVRHHSRSAMKEALMAWRSLIDGAIERIDKTETPAAPRVTKIKIE